MPYIQSKLGKTFYISKGRSINGSLPLICLHGGPGGSHIALMNLLELSTDRQVIIYDQIGTGKSTRTQKKDWSIKVLVQDLKNLLKELNIQEFDIYGTSWGGTLALEFYKSVKGKGVNSVILASSLISEKVWSEDAKKLINKLPENEKKVINMCHFIGATDAKVYRDAMKVYYKNFVYRKSTYPSYIVDSKVKGNEDLYVYMWGQSEFYATGTLKGYDGVEAYKSIQVPILLICGEFDEATPSSNRKFSKMNKNSKLVVIRNVAHVGYIENKKKYLLELIRFLK
ncbi:MAG: proline iminopeptidase [Thermoproteota archaeon]|jgi:proline iminopeptidase